MATSQLRPSFASAYARAVLNSRLLQTYNDQVEKNVAHLPAPPVSAPDRDASSDVPSGRICIVGAGSAGLMMALCLQYLGFTDIDIYEASDRVGGRIFTCPLDKSSDPHNYYDVGAMRIPDLPTMQSTLNMINNETIGLQAPDGKALGTRLLPYIYSLPIDPNNKDPNAAEPVMYWWQSQTPDDLKTASDQFGQAISTIASKFTGNFNDAFTDYVVKPGPDNIDSYSTRMWLQSKAPESDDPTWEWSYDNIENAETMETSSGLFDQAFSETIIDHCDFAATKQLNSKWFRLDGGMGLLTDAMASKVQSISGTNLIKKAPVTAMGQNFDDSITVTYTDPTSGESKVQTYGTVFNTTALPCLERMDTSQLGLDDSTLTAIRALSYDRASKVAIKFSSNWWSPLMDNQIGGVSSSDLPVSNVVYPSWDDGGNAVLMVSYAWAQDATRMGALIPDYSDPPVNTSSPPITPQKSDSVVALCLKNLAKLFAARKGPTYEQLLNKYVSHHAWAWSHDPYTGGAFALFGPGQFNKYYPTFSTMQCKGRFALAGEATSAHHAWISGALDSAYMTVVTWLMYWNDLEKVVKLQASPYGNGQGEHVFEYDSRLTYWAAKLSAGSDYLTGGKATDGTSGSQKVLS